MGTPSKKLLERASKGLREAGLLQPSDAETSTVPEVVRALIATAGSSQAETLNETQIKAWAAAVGDLASDRTLAVEALQLGILPAMPQFLQRYKGSSTQADISWSDALVGLHNLALCEDQGFPDALELLDPSDRKAIAMHLAYALKPGLHPSEARDAAARLSMYDAMINPLIDAEVLVALATYIPTIKPLNRLSQWGNDALREINNSMGALDMLVFMYTKQDREQDLPYSVLAASSLTGWVCDVLQGTSNNDPKFKDEVEGSRIGALECLTSLLINATICRQAVPNNRSMLFRVASAVTSTSSTALLSAAAQVLAQALSEEDLVQPNELASLHTYDLVRHLSQVLDESRDFKDLLNVLAALQNILDPAHFKGNVGAMRKVAERLVACSFEEMLAEFMQDPRKYFDVQTLVDGTVSPTQEELEGLQETAKGALDNARTLLQAVGPINVQVVPRLPRAQREKAAKAAAAAAAAAAGGKGSKASSGDAAPGPSGKEVSKPSKRKLGDGPSEASKRRRSATALPLAERVLLEKEMRRAATLAAPLLSGPPMRSVLDWFNEWGWCRKRLEQELGTDVHMEGGGHQLLLQDALEHADPWACHDLLREILLVKLPPLKEGMVAPAVKRTPKGPVQAKVEPGPAAATVPQPAVAAVAEVAAALVDQGTVQQQQQHYSEAVPMQH